MPSLFGIVEGPDRRDAAQALSAVCGGLRRGPRLQFESQVDPQGRWGLGRVHLGALQPDPQLNGGAAPEATSRPPRVRVLFHGDLDNLETLAADLERRGHARPTSASAIVSLLYTEDPGEFAARLKGAYVAAVLDEEAERLLIVGDVLGSYPVYWFHDRGRFVFAPELHAALRAHPSPALDMRTVSELVEFGFPVAERTLARGVSLLPPASLLTYDARRDAVTIAEYASIAALFQPSGIDRQAYLAQARTALDRAMDRAVAGSHRYGLSLSGGLDTRVILSAIDRLKVPLTTFTLGGRGCADQVIAEQLSALAHTAHHFVAIDEEYLDDLLPNVERMAALTDSMYLSHGFTEMRARQAFEESDFSVLLRGHAGELAKASTAWPFHTDARIRAMRSADDLPPYLASRFVNGAAAELFTERAREGVTHVEASLRDLLTGVDLGPADLTSYLYLRHYHRRVTIPSLEIFRDVADVRLPLADPDFLRAVLQGPPEWRDDTSLHQALIRANGSKYLRVRNPNTGAPAGAGPLQEFVFDKMNTILRRLNVYGYRHYHSFDGWMRGAFLAVVKRVTLDAETLGRGVYAEAAVRRRIAQAEQGDVAHDDLLQALVVVELWQRQNLA